MDSLIEFLENLIYQPMHNVSKSALNFQRRHVNGSK